MSISTEAIEAVARALVAYESERGCNCNDAACGNHTNPYRAAQIALTAAAPAIQAPAIQAAALRDAALRDAADSAFKDKKIQGLQRVLIGNWFRARAAIIEGKSE